MKRTVFAFCILIAAGSAAAQTGDAGKSDIVTIAEQMPSFPGGNKAMKDFISANVNYPEIEKEYGIRGVVYLTFVVEKDGSISDVRYLKPVKNGPGLNREALRLIRLMPKWQPGMQQKKPVRVQYILPVKFSLAAKPLSDAQMQQIATAHYKKGLELISAKRYKEALHELDYAVFYMPADINTLYQRGIAYQGIGDSRSACDQWNQVRFYGDTKADDMLNKYCR